MFGITDRMISYAAGAACLALSIALFFTYTAKHAAERRADKAEMVLADERTRTAEALAAATSKARETEQQLAVEAEKAEHEKQTQIAAVSARADALRKRLRNAEANAATARLVSAATKSPGAPEATGVDNWPVIFGSFGEQLVSEAERADQIRFQLATCERQYEAARDALMLHEAWPQKD